MIFNVSTVSADVEIVDLGILIVHPTVNRDLALEFSSTEIFASDDLTTEIQAGNLVVNDGQFEINQTDYDPAELRNQELGLYLDDRFISHDELKASIQDTPIFAGVFPLALNSTASVTKNVYAPGGRWGTWSLAPGDVVVISGSTAADGVYTVDTVTDAQNFTVVEAIPNSTGGTVTVYHPAASKRIGVDPTTLSFTTAATLQGALEDLSTGTVFDPNRQVLTTDGELVYIDKGNIVLTDTVPLPKSAFDKF